MDEVNNLTKVLDCLYLGDLDNSLDKTLLEDEGITHVVSVLDGSKRKYSQIKYHIIDIKDYPWINISKYFRRAIEFIHKARVDGNGVLVHCGMGISRSVTIIVAYLMTVTKLPWQQCLGAVQCIRPEASPNSGFLRQLGEFQESLKPDFLEKYTDYPMRYDDIKTIKQLFNQKNVTGQLDAFSKILHKIPSNVISSSSSSSTQQERELRMMMP